MSDYLVHNWQGVFALHHPTQSRSKKTFKAFIGCDYIVCDTLWGKYTLESHGFEEQHLLWMLSYLFVYPRSDTVMAGIWGKCEETFFNKVWMLINLLYDIIDEVGSMEQQLVSNEL